MRGLILISFLFLFNYKASFANTKQIKSDVKKNKTGGYLIDSKLFPNVFDLQMSDGFYCTGSLIGPQVILTAEHCANSDNVTGYLIHNKKRYNFTFHPHKKIALGDLDISVGLLDKPITDIPYFSIPNSYDHGRKFIALGYGCSGDKLAKYFLIPKEGILDTKEPYLTDLIGNQKEVMAFCGGDSGGPVLAYDYTGKLQLVGLNLQSNRVFLSVVLFLNKLWVREYFRKVTEQLQVEICGINKNCQV